MDKRAKAIVSIMFIAFFFPISIFAQILKGKIVDENKRPFQFVNIVLLSLPDSTFVAGTISDNNGMFTLATTTKKQIIRISSVGYKTIYSEVNSDNIGTIELSPSTQQLNEVIVKANLPITQIKGESILTNVENSILSKIGSANDVLGKIPGIIKVRDNFEVFGKGVPLIYVNGRKIRDLSELEQLNSDDIKSVEIINNPGSRYDATAKAVVRIQTIKRQGDGIGFNLRSSYYQSNNVDLIEQANINYRHKNFDIFGTINYNRMASLNNSDIILLKKGTQLWTHNTNTSSESLSKLLNSSIGFNLQIEENQYLGVKYKLGKDLVDKTWSQTNTSIFVNDKIYDNINSEDNNSTKYDLTHELNVYYNAQIGVANLDFNADYIQNGSKKNSFTQEISDNYENRNVNSLGNVKNRLAAGKLIISFPLGNSTLAIGTEMTYTHRNDDYINQENYVPLTFSKIKELNLAGFAEYNYKFAWGRLSAGLRYENIRFDYFENEKHIDDQSRIFNNIFPNISLSSKLGKIQTQLSYTAKTVRPSYRQLSNNVNYLDRFTLQKGNPTLRYTLIHDISFATIWKWILFSISYNQTKNWILYWGDLINEDGSQTLLGYRNWDKSIPALTAYISASPKIGCWSPVIGLGLKKQWLTVENFGIPYKMSSPIYIANFNNTFELPLEFILRLDASIQSKGSYQNIYMEHPTGSIDLSLRKSFFKDALSLELRGSDILNTNREYIHLYSGDYNIYQKNLLDRREFSITIRYKFNSTKSKYRGSGAGSEQKKRM